MADLKTEFTDLYYTSAGQGYCSGNCNDGDNRISYKLDKHKCREKCYLDNKCISFEYGGGWGPNYCRIYYPSYQGNCKYSDLAIMNSNTYTCNPITEPGCNTSHLFGKDVHCEKKNKFPRFIFDEGKHIKNNGAFLFSMQADITKLKNQNNVDAIADLQKKLNDFNASLNEQNNNSKLELKKVDKDIQLQITKLKEDLIAQSLNTNSKLTEQSMQNHNSKLDLKKADKDIQTQIAKLKNEDKSMKTQISKLELKKADEDIQIQITNLQTKLGILQNKLDFLPSYNDTPKQSANTNSEFKQLEKDIQDQINTLQDKLDNLLYYNKPSIKTQITKLEKEDKQILTTIAILQNKQGTTLTYPADVLNSSNTEDFQNFSNPSTTATTVAPPSSTLSSGAKLKLKTHYDNIKEYKSLFDSSSISNTNKNNYLRIFWINNIKKHYDDNTEDSENLYKTKMNMNKIADTHNHLIEVKKQELKELENSNNTNKRKIEINMNDKMFKNYRSTKLKYIFLAVFILTLFPLLANFDIIPKMTILILWLVVVFVLFIYIYFVFYVQERNRDDSNFNERNFIKPSDHEIARSRLMLEIDEKDKEKCAALSELGDIVDPSNFIVDENIMNKYYTKTNTDKLQCKI